MEDIMLNNGTQFELFPYARDRMSDIPRSRYLSKDLTLSIENIIVLGIIFLMAIVLFYSFGVERGKCVVKRSLIQASSGVVSSYSDVDGSVQGSVQPLTVEVNPKKSKVGTLEKTVVNEIPFVNSLTTDVQPTKKKKEVGSFTVQVASFKDKDLAQKEAGSLKKKGYKIFVLPKGNHSIVCVGKFGLKDEANEFLNNLKNRYNDCLVRRL